MSRRANLSAGLTEIHSFVCDDPTQLLCECDVPFAVGHRIIGVGERRDESFTLDELGNGLSQRLFSQCLCVWSGFRPQHFSSH